MNSSTTEMNQMYAFWYRSIRRLITNKQALIWFCRRFVFLFLNDNNHHQPVNGIAKHNRNLRRRYSLLSTIEEEDRHVSCCFHGVVPVIVAHPHRTGATHTGSTREQFFFLVHHLQQEEALCTESNPANLSPNFYFLSFIPINVVLVSY